MMCFRPDAFSGSFLLSHPTSISPLRLFLRTLSSRLLIINAHVNGGHGSPGSQATWRAPTAVSATLVPACASADADLSPAETLMRTLQWRQMGMLCNHLLIP